MTPQNLSPQADLSRIHILWCGSDSSQLAGLNRLNEFDISKGRNAADIRDKIKTAKYEVVVGDASWGATIWTELSQAPDHPAYVLMVNRDDRDLVPDFINLFPQIPLFSGATSIEDLAQLIRSAGKEFQLRNLQKESSKKNRELESLTTSLEAIVAERTRHIERAQIEAQEKLAKTRNLIRFIKDLATASVIEDLLEILRKDCKKEGLVGDPILLMKTETDHPNADGVIFHFHNGHFVRSGAGRQLLDIELDGDAKVQQYLANFFSRPFGKTAVTALQFFSVLSHKTKMSLCFEIFQADRESRAMEFISDRLQPFTVAAERILLEQEHAEKAYRWERTFDSFNSPISIISLDFDVLRSNKEFSTDNQQKKCFESFAGKTSPCDGCPLFHAEASGVPSEGTIQLADGRVFLVQSFPINLEGGKPTNFVNSYQDISRNRETYIRLLQSEKMGALGGLAGNIAHELNNPLTGIRSMAQILLRTYHDRPEVVSDLKEIEKAAERSQKIILNLQDFSKREVTPPEEICVDELIDRTLPMLKAAIRFHRVVLNLDASDIRVQGQSHLLQHVIFNLVNNACQAMGERGTLTINSEFDEASQHLVFSIGDTGPGIPPEVSERIFEPFFTTKKEGIGTGLGLSLAKDIITRMGGDIRYTSQLGVGTEFTVHLPGGKLASPDRR